MADVPESAKSDVMWLNADTCIENAEIAYEDSIEDEDGPVDTVISSGDLGVLIDLARYAVATRAAPQNDTHRVSYCDCEKSHNGLGLAGRECDCAAPPGMDREGVRWRERWYGSEPQKGSAVVDEWGNLIAHLGGDEATHAAVTRLVAAHNVTLSADAIRQGEGERGFCNKCGFVGVPQKGGFHYRPKDGQPCNYICPVPATPASRASDGGKA